ncbi:MAG: nucleotidyltransferase domain-containing protein [Candidatus Omnitrophica bacterium]|nr:nucleotidyltransferase domain-containing protein [Candidatus Omnitrophota bacterium]
MTTREPFNLIHLTKSTLKKRLLAYFFTNPDSKLYVREIAKWIDVDPTNLSKVLRILEREGIFISAKRGNQKYFSLNQNYALYHELKSTVFKTIGVKGAIESVVKNLGGVQRAFIYGSYAKSAEHVGSDIDLCVIVDQKRFDEESFLKELHALEKQLGREINYTFFTQKEWDAKKHSGDSFVTGLAKNKRIELISAKN